MSNNYLIFLRRLSILVRFSIKIRFSIQADDRIIFLLQVRFIGLIKCNNITITKQQSFQNTVVPYIGTERKCCGYHRKSGRDRKVWYYYEKICSEKTEWLDQWKTVCKEGADCTSCCYCHIWFYVFVLQYD